MVVHPLQPHLVATGTNAGVIVSEFDARSLPPVAALQTPPGSGEHSALFVVERGLKLLHFELLKTANPSFQDNNYLTETERSRRDTFEALPVKQVKKHTSIAVPYDSYSVLSVSSSGKYLAIVWPDIPYFSVYEANEWSVVDSGSARLLAWDTCRDRFAIMESVSPPRIPVIPKGFSSRKAREAAAAAQAAAAVASASSAGSVQVRILLDDGTSNVLMRSIGGRTDPVIGLHGGALLGVAYRTSRRATAISTVPLSGYAGSGLSSFSTHDDGWASNKSSSEVAPHNFQLYSWETFEPVGGLLPQPEWTAWDQTVEYCAFAYQHHIVISSLRPQHRYLGDVAISYATSGVWQRRQLFVATPTTVEILFVDAGVAPTDIETKKKKAELKMQEAQARAFTEHGELALITVEGPQADTKERMSLRPPMLQVVRLASFQHAPSVPPFLIIPKHSTYGEYPGVLREMEERKVNEVAVGGGGVSVTVSRFPAEQKRPIGPLVVVGVRDGVLWLIDRYMCAHAISLSHPGICCRCLVAYGDAVSAVKWAIRLGREHHDDLAQFLLGMGYATEALHLPGISKRLEFDMAMKSNDLRRALRCLLTMSNSRNIGHDNTGFDLSDILNATAQKENFVEAVQGIVKFAKEFLDLIDAADATGQADIAREALKRLATAGSVKGALQGHQIKGLALRLANHGELTRLGGLINNLIPLGLGREAAFASALLGDSALVEKAWHDTGMLAEAVLHAQAHGRPNLRNLAQTWNRVLQSELEPTPSKKTDAAAAFLASLEEPKLTSLAGKKPPIEIIPPGMISFSSPFPEQKKSTSTTLSSQSQPGEPLMLEAPPTEGVPPTGTEAPVANTGDSTTKSDAPATTSEPERTSLGSKTATAPVSDPPQPESTSEPASAPQASKQQSEETTEVTDVAPSSSSVVNEDSLVPGETNEPATMSAPNPPDSQSPVPQVHPVAPEIQQIVSPSMSLSDFLA